MSNSIPQATPVADERKGFAVAPKPHCEHCELVRVAAGVVLDINAPCTECGNVGENMQCLTCFVVMCGRHVQGHMVQHHEASGHPMVVGFADLSFWCYLCESYLASGNPHLRQLHGILQEIKFPTGQPWSA